MRIPGFFHSNMFFCYFCNKRIRDHSRDEFSEEYQKYNKGKQLKWKITKEIENTPISPDDILEKSRERAKEIYLERGNKQGDSLSDWLQAEKEMKLWLTL
jgi:parvulin-like peptidyl-prolyl isomerase